MLVRHVRALVLVAALAAAPTARAIDFTLLQVGGVAAALCAGNVLTDVTGVAVSYDLLDNNGPNVRFSWTITPLVGAPISQSQDFTLIPPAAVQTDVQDWFDTHFGGSVPVPGNPSIPWTGVIVGSPIDADGNPVGQSATFTVQCTGSGQASLVNIRVLQVASVAVPAGAPWALGALVLALLAFGARRLGRSQG